MSFTPVNTVAVGLDFGAGPQPVGRLALRDRVIYFEYAPGFLDRNLTISPLRLAVRPGLQTFDNALFEGLPGVFNDSLPDGWGRLLLDRALRADGVLPNQVSPLDRLVTVGHGGMGALVYDPDLGRQIEPHSLDLDRLAGQAREVLAGQSGEVLNELIALNGSSTGARPKAMIGFNSATDEVIHGSTDLPDGFEPWLVKFPNTQDGAEAGAVEFAYSQMARAAGVAMTETRLLRTPGQGAYFATRRFDRQGGGRLHAHTASGLLHADHRTPSLDYEDLLALTSLMTRDVREVEKMYRLAVFNALAHNKDDHAKNFTFLMDAGGEWKLSPAYDLTFSSGPGAEQSTMIMGEGRRLTLDHLTRLGKVARMTEASVRSIIQQTLDALADWEAIARAQGVPASTITFIGGRLAFES